MLLNSEKSLRLPPWLRVSLPRGRGFADTRGLLDDLALNTVCQSARCPNCFECFSKGTATFLIMGRVCTRNCAFCNITPGQAAPLDPDEPRRLAEAVVRLGLTHAVITSVTRDDLPDGGAAIWAETVERVRDAVPEIRVEVLVPDFRGAEEALECVLAARPEIFGHNLEKDQ